MNFDFDIFNLNQELELLNKKISSNDIVGSNYTNNVIKIEEKKKDEEFIITEINTDIPKIFEVLLISTNSPKYITPTRLEICFTTDKS